LTAKIGCFYILKPEKEKRMILKSWNKDTGFSELIKGRSYWSDVSIEQIKKNDVLVKICNKEMDKDGPRGAGVVLAALFSIFKQDNTLPTKITIESKTEFREESKPIIKFYSDIALRADFLKSFKNGKNILHFDMPAFTDNKREWKQYEIFVIEKMKEKFKGFEQIKIPGIDADGILQKNNSIVICEIKKKQLDLAEGLIQLIQYFIQVKNSKEYANKDISCFLISSELTQTDNFKRGLKFLKSDINPRFVFKK